MKGDLQPWQNPLLSSPLLSGLGPGPALLPSRRRTPLVSQCVSELSVSTAHSSWCSYEASVGPPFLSSCLFFLLRTLLYLKEQKLENQCPLASRHKSPKNQLSSQIVMMDMRVKGGQGCMPQGPDYRGDAGNHNSRGVPRL